MQSLATRFVLEEMGHKVYYVDYWPNYHKEKYALFSFSKFSKLNWPQKVKYLHQLLKYYKSKKRRIESFESFFDIYIYPYCRSVDDDYDVIIYGSDQIWRKQSAIGAYNSVYFGKNELKAKHHISYAASMGILPDNETDKEIVKELVSHLDKISVREEGLRRLLLSLGCKDVTLSLDPTLLLSAEEWDRHLPVEPYRGPGYVLVYLLTTNPFDINEIKKFADSKKLKLIILHGYAMAKETKTNIISAGPYEFIRLIQNAEYVFSASFHGLAFSIIFGKQVFVSFKNNSDRASSLLDQLGLSDRLLPQKSKVPSNMPLIDFDDIRKKLKELRKKSLYGLTNDLMCK